MPGFQFYDLCGSCPAYLLRNSQPVDHFIAKVGCRGLKSQILDLGRSGFSFVVVQYNLRFQRAQKFSPYQYNIMISGCVKGLAGNPRQTAAAFCLLGNCNPYMFIGYLPETAGIFR